MFTSIFTPSASHFGIMLTVVSFQPNFFSELLCFINSPTGSQIDKLMALFCCCFFSSTHQLFFINFQSLHFLICLIFCDNHFKKEVHSFFIEYCLAIFKAIKLSVSSFELRIGLIFFSLLQNF